MKRIDYVEMGWTPKIIKQEANANADDERVGRGRAMHLTFGGAQFLQCSRGSTRQGSLLRGNGRRRGEKEASS